MDLGSEYVEGVNAISGERCSPHPHVYSDRIIRPGDPAFFDILHSYNGYRTCYYRTFQVGSASPAQRDAYKICREYIDRAIAIVKPGVTTADICAVWPAATEFGFADEMAAFALQYGHGVGLSIWERPIFSRMISFDHPEVLEEGMVFALETYWPAADGWSASRIEEEVVVTADGCEVITRFPAEELLVCGTRYWTIDKPLPTLRESQSHLNTAAGTGERKCNRRRPRSGHHRASVGLRWPRGRGPADRPSVVLPEPFDPALDDADIDVDTRLALYRRQQEIRQLEKRLHDLFLQNLVKGTSHLALGMEAAAAAFGVALRPDDYSFATYRGHGHTIARGVPPGPIIAEMLGRGTGLLGGKGGSMHLTSVEHGMMGSYAIIGAHLCIANGAAWSARLRGTDQVAVAFFGDGATNIGAFHEALNFAAVYRLPTIFVCENNLYMEYTAIGEVTAVRHPAADRAAAYGLEPTVVDGNDADAVYLAARRPSSGPGPAVGRR